MRCGVGVTPPQALRLLKLPIYIDTQSLEFIPYRLYPISSVATKILNLSLEGYQLTISIISSGVISMAEAIIGLAASIGGLVAIALKVSMFCYSHYSEVMNAREDIKQLVSETSWDFQKATSNGPTKRRILWCGSKRSND